MSYGIYYDPSFPTRVGVVSEDRYPDIQSIEDFSGNQVKVAVFENMAVLLDNMQLDSEFVKNWSEKYGVKIELWEELAPKHTRPSEEELKELCKKAYDKIPEDRKHLFPDQK